MIISAIQIFDKAIGKRTLQKGSKILAKSAGGFIPFFLLLQFSLVALFGAGSTGAVTITGTAEVGHTLTASNNLADADGLGTITYQWYRDGVPIRNSIKREDGAVDGLDGARSVTLSPDGNHAYVTGGGDDAVSWYERNASTGALTYGGMLKDGVNGVDGIN